MKQNNILSLILLVYAYAFFHGAFVYALTKSIKLLFVGYFLVVITSYFILFLMELKK